MKSHCISLAILVTAFACSHSEPQHVSVRTLAFDVPSGWQRQDFDREGIDRSEWRPADNDAGESLIVMRSTRAPVAAKQASGEQLKGLLFEAQAGLPRARVGEAMETRVPAGMEGARVEVDFVDPKSQQSYHRVHVVLVEDGGASLVHVLYTTREVDRDSEALRLVLHSLHHEET